MLQRSILPAVFPVLLTLGCSAIPVQLHTETHLQRADGTVTHTSSDWEGTLDELPGQVAKAGKELGAVTAELAKELTDVPPPGKVTLGDLDPGLAPHAGKAGVDFLMNARDADGRPVTFEYVRLGEPSYDDFFRTAQEIHALVHQSTQTVGQLRRLAATVGGTPVDAGAELRAEVDRALGRADAGAEAGARLRELATVGGSLATLLPRVGSKVVALASAGQRLVTSAPKSLTNPKVVAHLDLVKKGLFTSVVVVKESGGALLAFGKELAGFPSLRSA